MSNKDKMLLESRTREADAALGSPMITSDMVMESAPAFAIGSLMISAAQSQSRAMEASVAQLSQTHLVGLATATQCVTRILEDPSRATLLNAVIAATNN